MATRKRIKLDYTDLPDEVLDLLICDDCTKYLSVPPVTMIAGRTLCGRCVNSKKNGTQSCLNTLLDNIYFKCVNRYDGCTALLSSSQVVAHELNCKSQSYACPLCPNTASKKWTYLLPHHIKKNHRHSYITQNNFKIQFGDIKSKIFFFKKENYLFFIQYTVKDDRGVVTLSLNASYVGGLDEESNVFQTYQLTSPQLSIATQKRKCLHIKHYSEDNVNVPNTFIIDDPNQSIDVKFFFEVPNDVHHYYGSLNPFIPSRKLSQCSSTSVESKETKVEDNILKMALLQKMEACKNDTCLFSRQIGFDEYTPLCMVENLLDQTASRLFLNDTGTKLTVQLPSSQLISICDHCILCNKIFNLNMWLTDSGTDRHLVCNRCEQLLSDYLDLVPFRSILSFKYLSFNYICKFCLSEVSHESQDTGECSDHSLWCSVVTNRRCCFKNCRYTFNIFNEASKHFRESHEEAELDFDRDSFNISTTEKKSIVKYILSRLTDTFIILRLDYIDGDFFLSAEICDDSTTLKHVLVMVFHKDIMIGKVLESKLKLDADSGYALKFAIL